MIMLIFEIHFLLIKILILGLLTNISMAQENASFRDKVEVIHLKTSDFHHSDLSVKYIEIDSQLNKFISTSIFDDSYNETSPFLSKYLFERIVIDNDYHMICWKGEGRYGSSKIYLSLQNQNTLQIKSSILVANKLADAGDNIKIESTLDLGNDPVVLKVFNQSWIDDSCCSSEKDLKIKFTEDLVNIYEIKGGEIVKIQRIDYLEK